MDPEQARYRDIFEALEKEAAEAKTPKRSGKVANSVVGAGCVRTRTAEGNCQTIVAREIAGRAARNSES